MENLKTTIGLEIHVQLKTKSKMFCRCDNQSFAEATDGKQASAVKPNTLVCPVCLGLPGALPVANEQAILWTIKTGLALNCEIPKIAKFDRKHYFYPDLPKGYQISQYDEPFAIQGWMEIGNQKSEIKKIRLNRIHLEEDAGKLIHHGNKSYVDLNRAGTPLMEIVTEPDITSPKEAGDFLRKLQKIVRDVVSVSEASMEKGHMRCDANISVSEKPKAEGEKPRMSPIIELKNLNSFKFVEKALTHVEEQLKDGVDEWPDKNSKETWGYDSKADKVYLQRRKEEAADYKYFPCPDLPPVDTTRFDLEVLSSEIAETEEEKVNKLVKLGVKASDAKILAGNKNQLKKFDIIAEVQLENYIAATANVIVNKMYDLEKVDLESAPIYAKGIQLFFDKKISKNQLVEVGKDISDGKIKKPEDLDKLVSNESGDDIAITIDKVLESNPNEVTRYKNGEKQLTGFFMGQVMKESKGRANPQIVNKMLREKLEAK